MTISCLKSVENYVRCQPSYPKKLLDYLYNDSGFSRESVIADIGSGTGLFTRLLLERGSRVVAIEPDTHMREVAERLLGDEFMRFVSLCATAENTTLFGESVHHIICANSLQRFSSDECKKEFARILKPEGKVVLIWNSYDYEDELTFEYHKLLGRWRSSDYNDTEEYHHRLAQNLLGTHTYTYTSFQNPQLVDMDGFRSKFLTNDNLPSQYDTCYSEMMNELIRLFENFSSCSRVQICYRTETFTGCLYN